MQRHSFPRPSPLPPPELRDIRCGPKRPALYVPGLSRLFQTGKPAVLALVGSSLLVPTASLYAGQKVDSPPFTTQAERCIVPASIHHGVNFHVLRAILVAESSLKSQAVSRNSNGSIDVGIGQVNSIHFKELAKFGIAPEHLLDACTSTYVAAWHLKKQIVAHGNTWEAIARYHSGTPTFNRRYQVLIKNELVRAGAMGGPIEPLPAVQVSNATQASAPAFAGVIVEDSP